MITLFHQQDGTVQVRDDGTTVSRHMSCEVAFWEAVAIAARNGQAIRIPYSCVIDLARQRRRTMAPTSGDEDL